MRFERTMPSPQSIQRAPSIFACPRARGNLRKQAVTLANRRFFCLRGTCYIDLSLSVRDCGLPAAVRPRTTRYPRKYDFMDAGWVGVRDNEECDGTHANRAET
jgi:hypothetical protein